MLRRKKSSTPPAPPRPPRQSRGLREAYIAGFDTTADEDLPAGVRWSIAAHVALALAIVLKNLVFPSVAKLYVPTLRVDMVGLPDVLKKDLTQVPKASNDEISKALKQAEQEAKRTQIKPLPDLPKPKSDVKPAAPDEMVLHPKQAGDPDETKRLKHNMSALERIKALEDLDTSAAASHVVKGNQVSHGTSLSGDAKEAAEESYYDLVRGRLQENWALPVWIARQSLSAQAQVYIDSRGRLRAFRIVKSSGNPQFDDAVKRTLNESQPYPAPPEGLQSALLADGILVGFPL